MAEIVFVCTGNTCRSPMASAIYNYYTKSQNSISRGIHAFDGARASPNAVKALEEIGIDLNNHFSKTLRKDDIDNANIILTMTKTHKDYIINYYGIEEKVYTIYEYIEKCNKDISDPFGGSIEEYISARDEIEILIKKLIEIER